MTGKISAFSAALIAMTATGVQAQTVVIPGTGVPHVLNTATYTQDFNSLSPSSLSSIPNTAMPSGWQGMETGSSADAVYQRGAASSAIGGVWSYGLGGADDRGLGGRAVLGVTSVSVGGIFQNALGGTIDSLAIAFTGEQWQNGFNRATMLFEYSLDATAINNGTWTSFSGLNFVAPSTAPHGGSQFGISSTRGDQTQFRTNVNGLIDGLAIGAGSTFGIRWTLNKAPGTSSDDGLAIDDLSMSATLAPVSAVPEPATWAMMIAGFGLVGGTMRRRRAVLLRTAMA